MAISTRASAVSPFVITGVVLLLVFIQYKQDSKKLSDCSVYTVGEIDRVYTLRGQIRIAYHYDINATMVKKTEGVNTFDTNETWSVDMEKLSKKRLLLQVYCNDINVHKILWDNPVPDTLRYVPVEGWKKTPFEENKPKD